MHSSDITTWVENYNDGNTIIVGLAETHFFMSAIDSIKRMCPMLQGGAQRSAYDTLWLIIQENNADDKGYLMYGLKSLYGLGTIIGQNIVKDIVTCIDEIGVVTMLMEYICYRLLVIATGNVQLLCDIDRSESLHNYNVMKLKLINLRIDMQALVLRFLSGDEFAIYYTAVANSEKTVLKQLLNYTNSNTEMGLVHVTSLLNQNCIGSILGIIDGAIGEHRKSGNCVANIKFSYTSTSIIEDVLEFESHYFITDITLVDSKSGESITIHPKTVKILTNN